MYVPREPLLFDMAAPTTLPRHDKHDDFSTRLYPGIDPQLYRSYT
jgi:hypothetical protein